MKNDDAMGAQPERAAGLSPNAAAKCGRRANLVVGVRLCPCERAEDSTERTGL